MSEQEPIQASPGGKPMGARGIALITVYLVLVTIVVFHSLVVLWPPNREVVDEKTQAILKPILERLDNLEKGRQGDTGAATGEAETPEEGAAGSAGEPDATEVSGTTEPPGTDLSSEEALGTELAEPIGTDLESGSGSGNGTPANEEDFVEGEKCADGKQVRAQLFWFMPLCLWEEERLFLIVMFAGALGGLVHAFRSFFWYAGCRRLVLSWTGFYITLPILGATMATVFYLVIRGGFFSPQSEISDTSPFGFAALAALIGMFTEQAAEKLKQITETIFATAPKGADHAGPPTLEDVSPNNGPQLGGTEVTLTGSGFVQGAKVTFGGQEATNVQVASGGTSITAKTPAAAEPGPVTVEVINQDGLKGSLANGFTYE